MVLIFLEVLLVYNVSSFEFHQVKLLWLHRQWWVAPNSPDLNPPDYQVWGKCWNVISIIIIIIIFFFIDTIILKMHRLQ